MYYSADEYVTIIAAIITKQKKLDKVHISIYKYRN